MKRQTLILVVIGVVLFIAGGGIAFASVMNGNKSPSLTTVAAVNTPVVVATKAIPAGTSGQDMVAQGLVSIEPVAQKAYQATDIPTLGGLTDQVLTSNVRAGQAIRSTDLTPSTTAINLPKGMDGVTISTTGVNGLAGYLQPGSDVDVYANVSKLSQLVGATTPTPNFAVPCTELLMTDIQVMDVSETTPSLSATSTPGGRSVPPSLDLLLAVTPAQARVITFMSNNETLAVTQTQRGTLPPIVGACIGTGQTTSAP